MAELGGESAVNAPIDLPVAGGTAKEITTTDRLDIAIDIDADEAFKYAWGTAGTAPGFTNYMTRPAGAWRISAIGRAGQSLFLEAKSGGPFTDAIRYVNIRGREV